MDQELTVQDINNRVIAICKKSKELTEDCGYAVDYFSSITDFTGGVYSHFRMADYVWIFSDEEGLTLNYMPIPVDGKENEWKYGIDISQVEKFDMPPKAKHENSPATDQSKQG